MRRAIFRSLLFVFSFDLSAQQQLASLHPQTAHDETVFGRCAQVKASRLLKPFYEHVGEIWREGYY